VLVVITAKRRCWPLLRRGRGDGGRRIGGGLAAAEHPEGLGDLRCREAPGPCEELHRLRRCLLRPDRRWGPLLGWAAFFLDALHPRELPTVVGALLHCLPDNKIKIPWLVLNIWFDKELKFASSFFVTINQPNKQSHEKTNIEAEECQC